MPVIPLFPTIIHGVDIQDFEEVKDNIIEFVYNEQKKDPKGLNLSNEGGWHSNNEYHFFENILKDFITKNVTNYFQSNSDTFSNDFQYKLTGLWMNINGNGGYNKSHMHPQSHMSGVCWLQLPKNSGGIVLQNASYFSCSKEISVYNKNFIEQMVLHPEYELFPGSGKMLLFPSSLYHCVQPNRSNEDRISISFNLEFG